MLDAAPAHGPGAAHDAHPARRAAPPARHAHRAGSFAPAHHRRARAAGARGARRGGGRGEARNTTSTGPGLLQARKYAFEIAANYSHAFVQIAEKLLGRVWNRVYDGVKFNHAETLKAGVRGQRGGLRALPPQPHGLPAAVVRDLPPGLRHAAHRGGHQSQHPGGRAVPAQGRRVLHPPHLRRQCALHRGVHEVPGRHHGARPLHRILHRRRPIAHRAAAAAQDRHAVDDGAQLPARPGAARWCSCRCTSATNASSRPIPISPSCPARRRRRRAGWTCCCRCGCCANVSAPCT